ncbi:hypothetical protein HanIR_Chr16g0844521 [Helianthus annuus]|nr:hypothetical protein HanIR_Chr16g0844521 [Helianthus annuus]
MTPNIRSTTPLTYFHPPFSPFTLHISIQVFIIWVCIESKIVRTNFNDSILFVNCLIIKFDNVYFYSHE